MICLKILSNTPQFDRLDDGVYRSAMAAWIVRCNESYNVTDFTSFKCEAKMLDLETGKHSDLETFEGIWKRTLK